MSEYLFYRFVVLFNTDNFINFIKTCIDQTLVTYLEGATKKQNMHGVTKRASAVLSLKTLACI